MKRSLVLLALLLFPATRGFGSVDEGEQAAGEAANLLGPCSLEKGIGKERVEAAEEGCSGGMGACCARAGDAYLLRRFGLNDDARARRLLEQGCNLGHGCQALAAMYRQGKGGPANLRRADELDARQASLYAVECEQGLPNRCVALAEMIESGTAKAQPYTARGLRDKAKKEYLASCGKGVADACTSLAVVLREQHVAAAEVNDLLEKACSAGAARGCYLRAFQGIGGDRGEGDLRAAIGYFERSCELGEAQGCQYLAEALERGEGAPADPEKALDLFEKGCDAGVASACVGVARALGRAGPRHDAEKAVCLLERVCASGETDACRELEKLRSR